MSGDGFAGSAVPGSCGAGTSPVPLPGHPVLSGVTPKREGGPGPSHTCGAFPALSRGWDSVEDTACPRGMQSREQGVCRAEGHVPAVAPVGMLQLLVFPSIHLIARFVVRAGIAAQRLAV